MLRLTRPKTKTRDGHNGYIEAAPSLLKIPFLLLPKVKEELPHMLEAGIIKEVTEPTD